jgi:hypothetical protein
VKDHGVSSSNRYTRYSANHNVILEEEMNITLKSTTFSEKTFNDGTNTGITIKVGIQMG